MKTNDVLTSNRSILSLIFLLFFQSALIFGQSIKLIDAGGPVPEVYVRVQQVGGEVVLEGLTDNNGLFNAGMKFSAGDRVELMIRHLSYASLDTTLSLTDGLTTIPIGTANYDLGAVTFVSGRINKQRSVTLNQRDFLRLASSFDDPSRVVVKAPGFTGTNDQNNSLSFRGMPSHYYKWQIGKLDIVNPNHLANAGTLQDLASVNGGGVNMVSGQLINKYQYHLPGTTHAQSGNQLAGVSQMELTDSIPSFVQASLLGLEAGLGINKNGHHFWANYRYSFTGLLADFGIDFGGESIKFQDVIANYSYEKNGNHSRVFGGWGNNSNLFTARDSITSFKDLQNIDYRGNTYFFGAENTMKLSKGKVLSFGFANSNKTANRNSESLSIIDDQSDFLLKQNMASAYVDFEFFSNMNLGFNYSGSNFEMNYQRSGEVTQNSNVQNKQISTSRLYYTIFCRSKNGFELTPMLAVDMHTGVKTVLKFNPRLQVRKYFSTGYSVSANLYNNSSVLAPPFDAQVVSSFNLELNAEKTLKAGQVGITGFYHNFSNTANSLDDIWSYNATIPILNTDGISRGITFYLSDAISEGWWYDVNASLLTIKNQDDLPALGDIRKSMNAQFGRTFQLGKRNLSIAAAFTMRDGQLSYVLDQNQLPVDNNKQIASSPYIRLDLRVNYKMKRSMLSLDLQNVLNRVNEGAYAYDPYLNQYTFIQQLGLVPLVSYRFFFHK